MTEQQTRKKETFEELISRTPKEAIEEHLHEISSYAHSSNDVPDEERKKMANKMIYLMRYE
jgi:hypothetical protein